MHPAPRWRLLALLLLVLAADACVRQTAGPPPLSLAEVVRGYERDVTPYYPFTASEQGRREYDRVFANDIGGEYREGMQALCARHRQALRRVDTGSLTASERLTYDILGYRLDLCLEDLQQPWHLLPVNQAGSWPTRFPAIGAGRGTHPFKTQRNYEDFLGRVDGFVAWVDTAIGNMRVGVERGFTQPRETVLKLIPQLDAHIVDDVTVSMFYEPIRRFPDGFDEATRQALTARYAAAIEHKIVPAYRRLRAYVHDEYLPRCRESAGLRELPGGRAMYLFAVRSATTTDLTPDEIYAMGDAEVQRLDAEIARVRAEIQSTGAPAPPRYGSIPELVAAYGELRTTVEAALPRLFGRLPLAGYEIRPIEAYRERSMPSSYQAAAVDGSRPGVFYLNVFEIRGGRTAQVFPALFLHEAVPGHHLQIALQREARLLPGFRRFGGYVAFIEGWALYAEGLGHELGAYATPHARLSALLSERFRAQRLVVDVGLHDRGWTRQQAIDYLGGRSDNAEREVDRYMVWPGQALGYKIGQLKILAIRRKAEAVLGAAFDVRAFHDEVLRDGAMPLSILEAKMERWIAARNAARG